MKSVFLAIAFVASASTLAFAQDQSPAPQQGGGMRGQFMQACGGDMQTYCSAAKSRDDRRSCVMANKDKFSDSCKSFMSSHPMHMHGQGGSGQ